MNFRSARLIALVVAVTTLLLSATVSYAGEPVSEYQVTITNLTEHQPLTPPVVATHRGRLHMFQVGKPARPELKEIAENGNLDPMVNALSNLNRVSEVVVAVAGNPPPLLPGNSVTFSITAGRSAQFLSFASMLICTNDGFTGVDSLRLPQEVGDSVNHESAAYDAGTEINTEDFADIVPPCPALSGVSSDDPGTGLSNPALAERGVIHHHAGIDGSLPNSDLTVENHGWDINAPVARIVIERVN